jgi:arylformamidase
MKKYKYLSYFLDNKTPLYGGKSGIGIEKLDDISSGDSANTKTIIMHNHSGTHIDFPNHFFDKGKVSSDYEPDFWIFENPFMLEIDIDENEIILLDHSTLNKIPKITDFLIINTGFYKFRGQKKFWNNNPGIHPDLAAVLRKRCPKLKILGMDFISLTSYQHRALGKVAHREFLGDNDILLVEDMKLDELKKSPSRVICLPILIKGIDGCPVTIISED